MHTVRRNTTKPTAAMDDNGETAIDWVKKAGRTDISPPADSPRRVREVRLGLSQQSIGSSNEISNNEFSRVHYYAYVDD